MRSSPFARASLSLTGLLGVLLLAAAVSAQEAQKAAAGGTPAAAPAHQVIACYFHRTNRCPTCQRVSTYIEEAIQKGYAAETKEGRVKVKMVDFQNPKNQKLTTAYKISGPTLVIMDVKDGKVTAWKTAAKVWGLAAQKDACLKYVQAEVRGYLEKN